MKILVTGGAGFIGSNFVRRTLDDAYPGLEAPRSSCSTRSPTPATSRTSRRSPIRPRYSFVHGDIRDADLLDELLAGHRRRRALRRRIPRRPLGARRRASSSRPTCSAPSGCSTRPAHRRRAGSSTSPPTRCTARSPRARWDEERPLEPNSPVLGDEGRQRPARAQLPPHPRPERVDHPLLEQLRSVPLPREGHPAVRHQPASTTSTCRSTATARTSATGCTSTTTPAASRSSLDRRSRRRDLQHRRRHRAHQPRAHRAAARRDRQGLVVRRPGRPTARATTCATRSTSRRSATSSATGPHGAVRAGPRRRRRSGTATTATGGSRSRPARRC